MSGYRQRSGACFLNGYSLAILVFTALVIVLTALNVPFFLVILYWLPMSIAIAVITATGMDSLVSFYGIFVPSCLGLAALVFLPLRFERYFRSKILQISMQIGLLMLYWILGLVVFYTTGSWTSV
jgi:hypothetical protein